MATEKIKIRPLVLQITVYTFTVLHITVLHNTVLHVHSLIHSQFYTSQFYTSQFYTFTVFKNDPHSVFKIDPQIELIWAPTIDQRCLNSTTGGEPWRLTVTITAEKAFGIYLFSEDIMNFSSKKLAQTFHSIASLTHALSLGVNLNIWPITLINWRD